MGGHSRVGDVMQVQRSNVLGYLHALGEWEAARAEWVDAREAVADWDANEGTRTSVHRGGSRTDWPSS
jgi:hypothetical protein